MNARTVVEQFCEQSGWAWTVWNQYRVLYEHSEDRVRLLDHVARDYFSFMHAVLVDYIYLQFCRLTDPPTQGTQSNLSAPYVTENLDWPPHVLGVLRSNLKLLLSFRQQVILPRRKLIAHADLQASVSGTPLGGFAEGADARFFEHLQAFVNTAYDHVVGGAYPLDAASTRDADNLVRILRQGVAFEGLLEAEAARADQLLRTSEFNGV